MHRLPLADQLPYRFYPPRVWPWLVRATKGFRAGMLRREHRVERIDVDGLDRMKPLLERGDGVLLTPNHCDRADGLVMLDLADTLDWPCCAMATHQIFSGGGGLASWLLPRLGIFPVDREGSDISAVKAAVEVLVGGRYPLIVFPEGEVYHTADRLTPLREGVAFLAATAAKKAADSGRTVWIVPIGMKYRFLDEHDPMPALLDLMDRLEARFTWRASPERSLLERIYRYADALISLKEMEYLDAAGSGPLPDRIARLRSHILDHLEEGHFGKRCVGTVPERVKALRRHLLERLADASLPRETACSHRRDLGDLFVAIQLFSYPGDYVRSGPTVERAAESLMKFEEDVLGSEVGAPRGPRRAVVRVGEPINVGECLKSGGKLRAVVGSLTDELERRIQDLLDAIGPGRPLEAGGHDIY